MSVDSTLFLEQFPVEPQQAVAGFRGLVLPMSATSYVDRRNVQVLRNGRNGMEPDGSNGWDIR